MRMRSVGKGTKLHLEKKSFMQLQLHHDSGSYTFKITRYFFVTIYISI